MAAAATFSLPPTAEFRHHYCTHIIQTLQTANSFVVSPPYLSAQSIFLSKPNRHLFHVRPPLSSSHPSDPPPSSSPPTLPYLANPLPTGRFLTPEELEKVQLLESFNYESDLPSGCLHIRAMRTEELDVTSKLLAESFSEAMVWPSGYLTVLGFLVKNYLIERRAVFPHAVTLLGFYREDCSSEEGELAGTVEVSFDKSGANATPPTPTPPKSCPYVCNMTVKTLLRRRGIGWHLLKASEQLITHMTSNREVYLHCRIMDSVPLSMYKKAGYEIVKTDSVMVLLRLQRRKHLMRKTLSPSSSHSEMVAVESEEESYE